MKESDSWKIFEQTGSVRDYLNYRLQYAQFAEGNEINGSKGQEQNDRTGYCSSERATGRI